MGAVRTWVATALLASVLVALLAGTAGAAKPKIKVLSNRADLVSGGDALVEIKAPRAALPKLRVQLNDAPAGHLFARRANGRYQGLVRGLRKGRNVLEARIGEGPGGRAVITNHPNGGPVFSGPQVKPWVCQEGARDRKCNQRPTYQLLYRPAGEQGFQPYDPANPPGNVAMTTTDRGVTVPFIIRLETGYQDRDQYKIATLFQPGKSWKPWAPQKQWNRKLLITHGYGCGVSYGAGQAPGVYGSGETGLPGISTGDVGGTALARGFAVASTALDNNSHNCNIAVQAESLVMLKERLVETRGPLRYTIATGCSGGSVVQQQVANAYPGIYQGLTPQCSYPDTFSPGAQFADYHMMRQYFETPSRWGPGVLWLPTQWGFAEGHIAHINAIVADEGLFKSAINPSYPCNGVTEAQRFHPQTNPGGVRCDALSYMINVLGPRPRRVWTPMERQLGRGFAGVPFGNVGVQYGLESLQQGLILPGQFADLNARIGGLSMTDLSVTPERLRGDARALRNAYRSGAFNQANNLDRVAIINLGGPDPGLAHDYSHAWFMRARLQREQGHLGNYAMWFGTTPILGSPQFGVEAFVAMDRWLAEVEADRRRIPLARKIVADRPADIQDRCEALPGVPLPGAICDIPLVQTRFGTPRTVAGDSIASDIGACRLKPLDRNDNYGPLPFSDAEWAKVEAAFPNGVCDWSKPGKGQRDTVAWLGYQRQDGKVVYGGRRMGSAPKGSGAGWTSAAFGDWRRGR
jgi:Tannase-like family of unknown function (DUF6351)